MRQGRVDPCTVLYCTVLLRGQCMNDQSRSSYATVQYVDDGVIQYLRSRWRSAMQSRMRCLRSIIPRKKNEYSKAVSRQGVISPVALQFSTVT